MRQYLKCNFHLQAETGNPQFEVSASATVAGEQVGSDFLMELNSMELNRTEEVDMSRIQIIPTNNFVPIPLMSPYPSTNTSSDPPSNTASRSHTPSSIKSKRRRTVTGELQAIAYVYENWMQYS